MPTASNSGARPDARIPELDGLRGFAILIVVLVHYAYSPDTSGPPLLVHIRNLFSFGWTGVDLFFVLSGFLIGGILLNAKSSTNYFKTFYVRRFYRIIPIYYLWTLGFIALVAFGGKFLRAHTHSGVLPPLGFDVFQHFLFLQNVFLPKQVTLASWWFGVTWSLAVEEQFYLVAPILIRFLNVTRLRILLLLVVLVAPVLRTFFYLRERFPSGHYYTLMPCRADSLALGVLAVLLWQDDRVRALLSVHKTRLSLLLATLFAGMIVLWVWFPSPFGGLTATIGLSWVAMFYVVVLLFVLLNPAGLIARFTRLRPLRELGRVSYCVYLIHVAVAYIVFNLISRTTPHLTDFKSLGLTIVCAVVTYMTARLSWTYFEGPLVQIGHHTRYLTIPAREALTLNQVGITNKPQADHS
ncbi:MAG TPA: acyltransferase [Candidatus Acidoferrum sp.]|nr:acyltransferase [Candidatus Acidoferrum sp.]